MLTKRANILFEEKLWNKLVKLAETKNISAGELIRTVVTEKFLEDEKLEKRKKAVEFTLKHRPKPFKGKIDYKTLINEGRKT